MIEAHGLVKRYGTAIALDNITFRVEQGEILGFLGPNGAGKTTTMRILTGYMPASEGTASIAGHDVFRESLKARQNLGYLPENVPLYPEMSVAGYLDYMARLHRVRDRRAAIARALEQVNLSERATVRIGKLSKGQRQRVGLAQALLHDPPVLILDEPTVGLDPRQIIEVRELIRQLGSERTIILSTHILPEVSQLCNRVVILHKGRIAAIDTPAALTARMEGAHRLQVQVAAPAADAADVLAAIAGVETVQAHGDGRFDVTTGREHDVRAHVAETVVAQGWGLLELRSVGVSMEDIFLQLTTRDPDAASAPPTAPDADDAAANDSEDQREHAA